MRWGGMGECKRGNKGGGYEVKTVIMMTRPTLNAVVNLL